MDISKVYKIFETLLRDEFSMIYSGVFSNSILTPLTDLINSFMTDPNVDMKKLNKKVAYMTIENFQNILRYSETGMAAASEKDMLLIRMLNRNIFIITVNLVRRSRAEQISNYVDTLNKLDKDELSDLYFQKLTNQAFSSKGGAGLGFIEMIRKTKNKLFYKFLPYDDEFMFFYFQIQISGKEVVNKDVNLLDSVSEIYHIIKQLGVNFLYKSKIAESRLMPLINMIKDSVQSSANVEGDRNVQYMRNLMNISVEILQDIFITARKSDLMKDAIFIYGFNQRSKNYYFLASSFVDTGMMKNKINIINKYLNKDKKTLQKMFFDSLLDDSTTDEELRFLGIFRGSCGFEYFVDFQNEDKTFFVQKVEVTKNEYYEEY